MGRMVGACRDGSRQGPAAIREVGGWVARKEIGQLDGWLAQCGATCFDLVLYVLKGRGTKI
jgi:hypothetical protein